MKVLLANTVENAKHFTRKTTTVVLAGKATPGKTARPVSYVDSLIQFLRGTMAYVMWHKLCGM